MYPNNNKNLNGIDASDNELQATDPYLVAVVRSVSENTAIAMDDLVSTATRRRTTLLGSRGKR